MSEDTITKAALLMLEGLLVSPETDIETIAAMPIEEVEEGLRQMGLNPDQSLPPEVSQLISEGKGRRQPLANHNRWSYRLREQTPIQKPDAHLSEHESQTTAQPTPFAFLEGEEHSQSIRNREVCTGRFHEADTIYRKGLNSYQAGCIDEAIEYWRRAKMIFLYIDLKREIAACDRNIGLAFQKLGQPSLAIEQFVRAKNVYRDIGLKDQVAYCNGYIGAAYQQLSGHTWR